MKIATLNQTSMLAHLKREVAINKYTSYFVYIPRKQEASTLLIVTKHPNHDICVEMSTNYHASLEQQALEWEVALKNPGIQQTSDCKAKFKKFHIDSKAQI